MTGKILCAGSVEGVRKVSKLMHVEEHGPYEDYTPEMEAEDDFELAKSWIQQGYMSTSNKYRTISRLPEGETGLEALQRCAPSAYRNIMRVAEQRAADTYCRMGYAEREGNQMTLDREEFAAFKRAGGQSSW